jgi:hypothetical protein
VYGKIFSSMFTGSMYGAGSPVFALMSYVIANMRPDSKVGFQVELNVKDLANRIGETPETIQKAIEFLCSPDSDSRSMEAEGRRLVKVGAFDYQVVNGIKYYQIRNEEERREKNRIRQQRHREKARQIPVGGYSSTAYEAAERAGSTPEQLGQIIRDSLPEDMQ